MVKWQRVTLVTPCPSLALALTCFVMLIISFLIACHEHNVTYCSDSITASKWCHYKPNGFESRCILWPKNWFPVTQMLDSEWLLSKGWERKCFFDVQRQCISQRPPAMCVCMTWIMHALWLELSNHLSFIWSQLKQGMNIPCHFCVLCFSCETKCKQQCSTEFKCSWNLMLIFPPITFTANASDSHSFSPVTFQKLIFAQHLYTITTPVACVCFSNCLCLYIHGGWAEIDVSILVGFLSMPGSVSTVPCFPCLSAHGTYLDHIWSIVSLGSPLSVPSYYYASFFFSTISSFPFHVSLSAIHAPHSRFSIYGNTQAEISYMG